MSAIAQARGATGVLDDLAQRLAELIAQRGAHAARTVVLVPYAQLMPLARRAWARQAPDGFTPRFETTMNWAARGGFAPGPQDLSFDRGLDLLTARFWLERAGLARQAAMLAPQLVDAAWQLGGVAAAVLPAARSEWAARARGVTGLGLDDPVMALEAAVARIAIEWAAASAYATDALLEARTLDGIELLVVLQGLQPEPVAEAIVRELGERAVCWPLEDPAPMGQVALHACADPAHEAERAAACVMRHLEAGRAPVALAAVDRVLTRRIRATLSARGVGLADETGWKLSTTRAAAQVMGLLKACAWDASSDEVIDWLKNTPSVPSILALSLERRVRRAGLRAWSSVRPERLLSHPREAPGAWAGLIEQAQGWRDRLRQARPLPEWQQVVRELLQAAGAWDALEADDAGAQLVAALGLDLAGQTLWSQLPQSARRLSLYEFTAWVNETLESQSFVPDPSGPAQVVVLPFNQLLGRRFAALVVPGCDEVRLAPSPEPPGPWTVAQREVLGLPARELLEQTLRAGWRQALQTAQVDVLWRLTDEAGEPVLASPLVQQLEFARGAQRAPDAREVRALEPAPVARPQARASTLTVQSLSASAYDDLRKCPYRFFALRQLGLQEASEIDQDLDKRDFGNWVHEVLRRFHEALRDDPQVQDLPRAQVLDRVAREVTRVLSLPPEEFLPFEAAWPQVRDGYLQELARFEAAYGARFHEAEADREVALGTVRLFGRIDRIDHLPDGQRMVMDYKTEGLPGTQARVKLPFEDTQLAFYAALLEDDSLRAAYVNVGERGETKFIEQPQVLAARDALVQGVMDDLRRIGEGERLQALGEGQACNFCAARGLCRKDFWAP
ncbi:MAG: putative ATP-dependent nuclease subunit [Pseudomonadota bacterium]